MKWGIIVLDITLIAMGRLKEKFYISAAAEYEKRLKSYCQFRLIELPEARIGENPSSAEILAGLEKEAKQKGQEEFGAGASGCSAFYPVWPADRAW